MGASGMSATAGWRGSVWALGWSDVVRLPGRDRVVRVELGCHNSIAVVTTGDDPRCLGVVVVVGRARGAVAVGSCLAYSGRGRLALGVGAWRAACQGLAAAGSQGWPAVSLVSTSAGRSPCFLAVCV